MVKRGARTDEFECAEAKVREKREKIIEVDGIYYCDNLRIVWKNVRTIRMREKQLELEESMRMYDCDICTINETELNGDKYVEVSNLHRWVCTNRNWSKGKYGGFYHEKRY